MWKLLCGKFSKHFHTRAFQKATNCPHTHIRDARFSSLSPQNGRDCEIVRKANAGGQTTDTMSTKTVYNFSHPSSGRERELGIWNGGLHLPPRRPRTRTDRCAAAGPWDPSASRPAR